ncbi:MAG TPA: HEAT repeat domain-containing protein, partial [Polyangiales bacterium]
MDVRDVRKVFRDLPFAGKEEIEGWVQAVSPVQIAELPKLLAILTDKALAADNAKHRARCYAFLKLAESARDPQLFVHYARALRQADSALRSLLQALLPRVNNVSAHGELCELLGVSDEATRQAAAKVLTEVASAQAYKALEALVAKKDFAGRMEAMAAVVPRAQHRAIPLLREVLAHGKLHERSRALAYLGDATLMARDLEGAVQGVAAALGDADERVVSAAIGALSSLCEETLFLEHIEALKDTQSLPLVRAIVEALRNYKSSSAIEWLARKLRVGPNAIRLASIGSLEAIGTDDVVPTLVEALRHPHLVVRNRAAEALSNLAGQHRVELARTVIWLLRSPDVNVRRMAVELARKVGDPTGELTQKLLRFLRDEDWWVRERVADALVEMSGQSLTRHVVDYLSDESDVVRRYAVGFLKRLKDPRALGALVRTAQSDSDWWTREWAIEAMGELADLRAAPYLADILEREPGLCVPCLAALGVLSSAEHVELIASCLGNTDSEVRIEAARALGAIGDRRAVTALTELLSDPEHRVLSEVKKALSQLDSVQLGAAGGSERAQTLLDRMLLATAQREGDDLILAADRRPYIKKHGKTVPLIDQVFSADEIRSMLGPSLSVNQQLTLGRLLDVDFSYELKAAGLRFRAHVFQQRSGPSAIFRIVKQDIRPLEALGVPQIVQTFADFNNGLVLIGGPTGSGKS